MSDAIFGPGFSSLPEAQRLRKVAEELEAVVLTQLLATMRKSVPETDLFGKSAGHDVFQALLDGEMARATAERSPFGLADAVVARFENSFKPEAGSAEESDGPAATPISSPAGPEPSPRRSWRI